MKLIEMFLHMHRKSTLRCGCASKTGGARLARFVFGVMRVHAAGQMRQRSAAARVSSHATHRLISPSTKIPGSHSLNSKIDIRTFEGLCVCLYLSPEAVPTSFWERLRKFFFGGKNPARAGELNI